MAVRLEKKNKGEWSRLQVVVTTKLIEHFVNSSASMEQLVAIALSPEVLSVYESMRTILTEHADHGHVPLPWTCISIESHVIGFSCQSHKWTRKNKTISPFKLCMMFLLQKTIWKKLELSMNWITDSEILNTLFGAGAM